MAASLAHEIRNPLGGIQLYASMLRRDLEADAPKVRTLDRILGAISGLDRLVDDMLEFGRDLEPKKLRQPLAPIVEQALDLSRALLEEKAVRVERRGEAGEVDADGEMIARVLLNVVRNAAQAMSPGGTLAIEYAERSVCVADDGPGIPAEILPRIFTPFLTSKTKGTGLGLAIAHKIVEAHGGTIEVGNGTERGARVTIRL
jgi:signal transduction histidine kinase